MLAHLKMSLRDHDLQIRPHEHLGPIKWLVPEFLFSLSHVVGKAAYGDGVEMRSKTVWWFLPNWRFSSCLLLLVKCQLQTSPEAKQTQVLSLKSLIMKNIYQIYFKIETGHRTISKYFLWNNHTGTKWGLWWVLDKDPYGLKVLAYVQINSNTSLLLQYRNIIIIIRWKYSFLPFSFEPGP